MSSWREAIRMATLDLFATGYCWQCSDCRQKFDALWRPTEYPFKPNEAYRWTEDPPRFNYCPICGKHFENRTYEMTERLHI